MQSPVEKEEVNANAREVRTTGKNREFERDRENHGGILVIGKLATVLAISLLFAVPMMAPAAHHPVMNRYALIIAPTHEGGHVLEDALEMREYLLTRGFDDGSIIFLTDGSDAAFVDGDSTKFEIMAAMDYLAHRVTPFDQVLIVCGDDGVCGGGSSSFITSDRQLVADHEFASWLEPIRTERMALVLSFDFSGGFIDDTAGPGKLVVTSHHNFEESMDNQYNIVRGLTNPEADQNHDGIVSFEEAHMWVSGEVYEQTPQMDDQVYGDFIL